MSGAELAGSGPLRLAASLDLKAASQLRDEILALRGRPLSVDASDVQQVGGLCLQVLAAAKNAWQAEGLPFEVAPTSPEFDRGLALMGTSATRISTEKGL